MFDDKLKIPGAHHLMLPGLSGDLEAIIEVPEHVNHQHLAILGHPHSLQGGTMQNKVVTTMARAFRELGIASIRFNFRGVGLSAGAYDEGIGESEDMLHVLSLIACSGLTLYFAGFSFGSYVTYKALSHYQTAHTNKTALISIAPSVQKYDYTMPLQADTPWLVVMGDADELIPFSQITDFVSTVDHKLILERFPNTGHFFHGKLLDLKAILQKYIREWFHV